MVYCDIDDALDLGEINSAISISLLWIFVVPLGAEKFSFLEIEILHEICAQDILALLG